MHSYLHYLDEIKRISPDINSACINITLPLIKKNAWSQSNRSKQYNILVLSTAILREVCKGLGTDEEPRFPANLSLTRVKSSRGRENTLPSTLLMRACSQSYLSSPGATLFLLNLALFFFCFLLKLFSSFVKLSPNWSSAHVLGLGLEHTMGKKSSPSTLNFSTFVLRITWNLTPPFSPLSIPKLIKERKEHHEWHAARDPRHFSCECFFCVNDYVIMKTEIRAARALAWRLLGLVTQHSEKGALRDQSK